MISLPQKDEYNAFYQTYISQIEGQNPIERLKKQKTEFTDLLKAITEEQSNSAYAEGKWTIKEVLNHINDIERIFTFRALTIARGDEQPLPGMDHNLYQVSAKNPKRLFSSYLEEFEAIRTASMFLFDNMDEETSMRWGTASDNKVTVRALLAMTIGHAAHHLQILKERYL